MASKVSRGEVRALNLLGLIERAQSDPDLALDLRRTAASLSDSARSYLQLLVEEGALSDSVAARKLRLSGEAFAAAASELERAIATLSE